MSLHRHKWQYLSKEVSTVETEENTSHLMLSLSKTKTTKQEVTYIKRFCKRCGTIDVQTVLGKLLTKDLQTLGYYEP